MQKMARVFIEKRGLLGHDKNGMFVMIARVLKI
jgi:hypothetical protein